MFVFEVVAHLVLRDTGYFCPEVIWGAFALTVVVGLGQPVAGEESVDDREG